jgi:predicted nucleic acid-binding protein
MAGSLFDTSLYVALLRRSDDGTAILQRLIPNANLWLSAVVLEELYAGSNDRSKPWVKRLEIDFVREDRILVPNLEDWIWTGEVLSRLAIKYGYEQIGRGRLPNGALIAMSAARTGIRIVTSNAKDFQRLTEFRPFQWQLFTV